MTSQLDQAIRQAKWVTAPSAMAAPVISRTLTLRHPHECAIAVSALGFFILRVNGVRVGDDYFLPSNSVFRRRAFRRITYPIADEFTYRCYYSTYDLSGYVHDGDNLLEMALGDGWYRQTERIAEGEMAFGDALGTIFAVRLTDADGERIVCSDGTEPCRSSATVYSQLFIGERIDARIDRDRSYTYAQVSVTELPDTLLTPEDSQPDRIIRRLIPKPLRTVGDTTVFDAGENVSGFAVVTAAPADGQEIRVRFAENLRGDALDFDTTGANYRCTSGRQQIMEDVFVGDGATHTFAPQFVWHAFRYLEVTGPGVQSVSVAVVHADTPVTAAFECSSPELNWLFDAYVRTQLDNMHGGVPSDCPHRERLGYTGDGQVCAPAAMLMLDSRAFYRKWIRDIFDSQDKTTGHVNHTAPFAGGGGGPGGWGCAAVTVPYHFYRQFGDIGPLAEHYDDMRLWLDYLESRSEQGLVTREEEGGWCLGDWCTLDKTVIPEPFVNTCLFMHSLRLMREIAALLGKPSADTERFDALYEAAKAGVCAHYYDATTSSFAGGVQGADAFALHAGLGDERTLANLLRAYESAESFDTGFVCTPILVELLFAHGRADVAFRLLTSHQRGGYGHMLDHGATTIWERWDGCGSHNHPMFGASAASLLTDILGITQRDGSAAFRELVIAPRVPPQLTFARGAVTLPQGRVQVAWTRNGDGLDVEVTLPEQVSCNFEYGGMTRTLSGGRNVFHVKQM